MCQKDSQSIDDYYEAATNIITMYASAGMVAPDSEQQAITFMRGADTKRYGQAVSRLDNEVKFSRGAYPKTLSDMYMYLHEYTPEVNKPDPVQTAAMQTVYKAIAKDQKKKAKEQKSQQQQQKAESKQETSGKRGGKDGANKKSNATTTDKPTDSQRAPPTPCRTCASLGFPGEMHWHSKCPRQDEAIAILTRHAAECSGVKSGTSAKPTHTSHVINHGGSSMPSAAVSSQDADPYAGATYYANLNATFTVRSAVLSNSHKPRPDNDYNVLLDNQSTVDLIHNPNLLANIRDLEHPQEVSGLGDNIVTAHKCGELRYFGTVLYAPDAGVNVISYAKASDNDAFELGYIGRPTDKFWLLASDRLFTFERCGLNYVCDMRTNKPTSPPLERRTAFPMLSDVPEKPTEPPDIVSAVANPSTHKQSVISSLLKHPLFRTVAESEARCTKREVTSARRAGNFLALLGYPSIARAVEAIKAGAFTDLDFTISDLHRFVRIYGPVIAALKGKTRTYKPEIIPFEPVPRTVQEGQQLHLDLMFVEGDPYLISVSKPLSLGMITHLGGSKSAPVVQTALLNIINVYKRHGFRILSVSSDEEGGIRAFEATLSSMGVHLQILAAGTPDTPVERLIQTVKNGARCTIFTLPYTLAFSDMKFLIEYIMLCVNMLCNSQRVYGVSPREAFTGRKVSVKRDLRAPFGAYLQATAINTIKNSLAPRTEGCIALVPLCNQEGAVKCLKLETFQVINRSQFKIISPIPDEVITLLNKRAASQKRQLPKEPIFTLNGRAIQVHHDDLDDPADPLIAGVEPAQHLIEPAAQQQQPHQEHTDPVPPAVVEPAIAPLPPVDNIANDGGVVVEDVSDSDDEDDIGATEPTVPETTVPVPPPAEPPPQRSSGRKRRSTADANPDYIYKITIKRALKQFGRDALLAATKEIAQMPDKNVFVPQDWRRLSNNQLRKVIRSSMFFKEKYDAAGNFEKLKARLVAGGDQQDRTVYSDTDISSPTVATSAVFIMAAIAAQERRHVVTVDIAGAYLNADMGDQEVLMNLDKTLAEILVKLKPEYKPFLRPDGTMIVKLTKALYGCIESARLWYENISKTLIALGFVQNPLDICVFNVVRNGKQCSIALHVDDLMITCALQETIEWIISALEAKYSTITVNRGEVHSYLGMVFDFRKPGSVKITMERYTKDILDSYQVRGTAQTPATENLFVIDANSPALDSEQADEFHSRVAKLLFLCKRVRPEILTAVGFLTTRVQAPPLQDDWNKLERVLKYLNGAPHMGIILSPDRDLSLLIYVDASYGVHWDAKSHTGMSIALGKGPIFVKSSKQRLVSKSSTEAELIGLSDCATQAIWTRNFLEQQGYKVGPATIYQDNMSTMQLAENGRSMSERTRHIHVRYYFIKDRIDSGEVEIKYMPTKLMIADILTKPLQGELFRALRAMLLNWYDED